MLTAKDVMTREVVTVKPETPVEDIAQLLYSQRISGVPVVDGSGKVTGMVSEGDLMSHVGAVGEEPAKRSWWLRLISAAPDTAERFTRTHGRKASDVMSRKLVSVGEDTPLAEIARLLEKNRIKRVPVLADGKLVGLISRANLLRGLAVARPEKSVSADDRALGDAITKELRKHPWGLFTNVIVQDGVAHLWGFIDAESERRAIALIAEETPGVRGVEDHLTFRPVYEG
ncbi:MAG: CBS domain-containing protein [Salinarimonas sp.]